MKKLLLLLFVCSLSNAQLIFPVEGFEGATFPPTGWSTINTVATATNQWKSSTSSTFVVSGDQCALVQWVADDQDEWLISPSFDLSSATSAYANFNAVLGYEYMVDPNNNADLLIKISTDDGVTWDLLWAEEDYGIYADYDVLAISLDLSLYLGNANCKIAFNYVGFDADTIGIDNFSVTGCSLVQNLSLTALTGTTATFTWDPNQDSYDIDFGPISLPQGDGTLSNQTAASLPLTGLTEGTAYRFYIRSNCAGGGTGPWEGPFNIYTQLTTPTTVPYNYGFETGTFNTAGWQSTTGTGGAWGLSTGTGALIQDGAALAFCSSSTTAATNDFLYSRAMTLQAGEIITLQYYIRKLNVAGTTAVINMRSKIGTAATAAAQTTTLLTHANFTPQVYTVQTVNYTAPAAGNYYVGFQCYSPTHSATQQAYVLLDAVSFTSNLSNNQFDLLDSLSVYPVPATTEVNVSLDDALLESIEIADLNGRIVKSMKVNATSTTINVSDLSTGVYMMNIKSDKGNVVKKIVKQ
ncbi:MAG: choice-of-anchor J domain-containing protein [Flavobacterium sp.]|uniref:T9SS type A sorting domain-containing protein n=1 Tax=Flavobacterium sp. TaxID=239 RepID=UPI003BC45F25